MNNLDKDKLYELIDEDESLTDEEKRDVYFAEIEDNEMEKEWEDSNFP